MIESTTPPQDVPTSRACEGRRETGWDVSTSFVELPSEPRRWGLPYAAERAYQAREPPRHR